MERQCEGTMKLLENYSNLDLTGNLNLELLEPGGLCKVIRVIQILITLHICVFGVPEGFKRFLMVRLDERFSTSLLN